jgi:hypothetical protein
MTTVKKNVLENPGVAYLPSLAEQLVALSEDRR